MNSPRLKCYHNPESVDESRVPNGWRFLYHGELLSPKTKIKLHFPDAAHAVNGWVDEYEWAALDEGFAYVVPVNT